MTEKVLQQTPRNPSCSFRSSLDLRGKASCFAERVVEEVAAVALEAVEEAAVATVGGARKDLPTQEGPVEDPSQSHLVGSRSQLVLPASEAAQSSSYRLLSHFLAARLVVAHGIRCMELRKSGDSCLFL